MDFVTHYLPELIALIAAVLYLGFHVTFAVGLLRTSRGHGSVDEHVSVVIAARNEEKTIDHLVESLSEQSVLPNEVIFVDDRSGDATAARIRSHAATNQRIKLVSIDATPDGKAPKKYALERGVEAATSEIILCTDADCAPPRRWVELMRDRLTPDAGAVVGTYVPAPIPAGSGPASRLFYRFLRYERFRLALHGLGAAAAGFPWLASGASFAYRKEAFLRVGGFGDLHRSLSGDDDLLVQRIHQRSGMKVRILPDAEAAVVTEMPTGPGDFIRQRLRHGSATRFYLPSVKVHLAVYHLSNIILLASAIGAVFTGSTEFLAAYAVKISADLLFFSAAESRLRRAADWIWFVPMEFLYLVYTLTVSPVGFIARQVRWKGPDR